LCSVFGYDPMLCFGGFFVVVCDWTECWSGGECTGMDWCFHKYLGSCRPLVMSTKMMRPPIDQLSIHSSIHPSIHRDIKKALTTLVNIWSPPCEAPFQVKKFMSIEWRGLHCQWCNFLFILFDFNWVSKSPLVGGLFYFSFSLCNFFLF
jgi:hypothetical protein